MKQIVGIGHQGYVLLMELRMLQCVKQWLKKEGQEEAGL